MRFITSTIFKTGIVLIALAGLSMPLQAEQDLPLRSSKSIGYPAGSSPDETARETTLDQTEVDLLPALLKQGFRPESGVTGVHVENTSYHYGGDITIFDTFTTLISDFDGDGFYHRFSVAIDADTVYSTSWVYAELYLSFEGGPWNYYASSDDFHIHGDSEQDIYVVETELAEGFPAGYYDIRVELYDIATGDLLHVFGPYDDDSLSALPLEDSIYDDDHHISGVTTEVIVAGHGGLGWVFLTAMLLTGLLRRTGVRR